MGNTLQCTVFVVAMTYQVLNANADETLTKTKMQEYKALYKNSPRGFFDGSEENFIVRKKKNQEEFSFFDDSVSELEEVNQVESKLNLQLGKKTPTKPTKKARNFIKENIDNISKGKNKKYTKAPKLDGSDDTFSHASNYYSTKKVASKENVYFKEKVNDDSSLFSRDFDNIIDLSKEFNEAELFNLSTCKGTKEFKYQGKKCSQYEYLTNKNNKATRCMEDFMWNPKKVQKRSTEKIYAQDACPQCGQCIPQH
jgi:hypothetical protein